ncbi:MAG: FapA family protein [Salinispira sp.]
MVDLLHIQDYMRRSLEGDMKRRNVSVSGENLQDALKQASIELALPLRKIEYEVLDAGHKGALGIHKKPCRILAYPAFVMSEAAAEDDEQHAVQIEELVSSINGKISIRRDSRGIIMKVTKPCEGGKSATEKDALNVLKQKNIHNADLSLVGKLVKKADDMSVKIADFDHDSAQDASMIADIQDMEMKATILISHPGPKGADPSYDAIMSFLRFQNVTSGFLDNVIHDLAENPVYDCPICIARGKKARHGKDGRIDLKFQVQSDAVRLREIDGKVDFKNLGKINNVVSGQVLANLIEPEIGEDGKTVTGRLFPANHGNPVQLNVGKHVRLSDDGLSAIAEINGQVLCINGKISVEAVYIVNNSVNLKTGNIMFLGTVIIAGTVEDGFSVKAAGNIEITGSVGKCTLDAEGDIVIRQGMNGREEGKITANGNIYAKFIQNTNVVTSGMVIVSDGIINSKVSSDRKILCKGKRASIVGGNLRASEEINAKTLGSIANIETVLEVGFDPQSKEKLDAFVVEEKEINGVLDGITKNILLLERMLRSQKKLSPEHRDRYTELKEQKNSILNRLDDIAEERERIHIHLNDLKTAGKISASGVVHPGVKVAIKDATLEVRREFKQVTFVNEDNVIKVTKYEEIEEDISMVRIVKQR